jgi:hypothetical protein
MSVLDISDITGWQEDHWKVTEPGNWKEFLAENENGISLWLADPGGRGDNWSVKIGKSTRLNESTHICSGLSSRTTAVAKAIEFMEANPTLKYQNDYPAFVTENGERYNPI